MPSMKGMITGSDLFIDINAYLDKLGLKWDKLAAFTTDDSPNLMRKNVRFFKQM